MGPWTLRAQLGELASKPKGTGAIYAAECAAGSAFCWWTVRNIPPDRATNEPAWPVNL